MNLDLSLNNIIVRSKFFIDDRYGGMQGSECRGYGIAYDGTYIGINETWSTTYSVTTEDMWDATSNIKLYIS